MSGITFVPLAEYGLVELPEAARMSGWSPDTLRIAARKGKLRAVKLSGARPVYLFDPRDLAKLPAARAAGRPVKAV